MDQKRTDVHNIVASLVTGPLENKLRAHLLLRFGDYRKASEVTTEAFREAREAMINRIAGDNLTPSRRIVDAARGALMHLIDGYVPARGNLTFINCTHEQYAGGRTFTEHFNQLFRDPKDPQTIFAEYSDHVDEGRKPDTDEWSTDELTAFSLDELVEIATALEAGRYKVLAKYPSGQTKD